jgi:hypothetical protein
MTRGRPLDGQPVRRGSHPARAGRGGDRGPPERRGLLAAPRADALEEAGRLRILGTSASASATSPVAGAWSRRPLRATARLGRPVDEGYCLMHQAEEGLAAGQAEDAVRIAQLAAERSRLRPRHVVGLALGEAAPVDALAQLAGARPDPPSTPHPATLRPATTRCCNCAWEQRRRSSWRRWVATGTPCVCWGSWWSVPRPSVARTTPTGSHVVCRTSGRRDQSVAWA